MAGEDRGGLNYKIKVENEFSAALAAFRTELRDARAEFAAFKKDAAELSTASRRSASAVKSTADAAQAGVQSFRRAAAAIRQGTEELSIREKAERRYAAAVQKAAEAREFARVSEERGFGVQRRVLTAEQARVAAITSLTRVLNKKLVTEQLLQELQERGISLTTQERRSLGILTREEDRLTRAKQRLADTTELLNNKELFSLRVQERVAALKGRAALAADSAAALAAQGLDKSGRPLQPEVPFLSKVQGKADAIKLRADEKATLRFILAAQGRDINGNPLPPVPSVDDRAKRIMAAFDDREKLRLALAAQGRDINGRPLPPPPPPPRPDTAAIDEAHQKTNLLLRSLQRVVVIAVAFAAFRTVAQLIGAAAREMVNFNAKLEVANLGIASVIASTATLVSITGKATTAAERLALAQVAAREQVKKLRFDALETAGSFEDLVINFQTALGPGFAAGLDIDQIRKIAKQFSLAASAIGLEQNRLAEEIRSILTGTPKKGQTRIADILGITGEDIRLAQRQGRLFDFLQEKLAAFDAAGKQAAKTLPGLRERLAEAFEAILGQGGRGTFTALQSLLESTNSLLVQIDESSGKITLNSNLVRAAEIISEGFEFALNQARELISEVSDGQITDIAVFVRDTIIFVSALARGFIQGLIEGFQVISQVVQAVTGLNLFNPDDLATVVKHIVKIGVLILAIQGVLSLIDIGVVIWLRSMYALGVATRTVLGAARLTVAAYRGFSTALRAAEVAMVGLGVKSGPVLGTMLALVAAVASLLFMFDQMRETPLFDLQNSKVIEKLVALSRILPVNGIFGPAIAIQDVIQTASQSKDLDEFNRLFLEQRKQALEVLKGQRSEGKSMEQVFEEATNRVKGFFTDMFKTATDEAAKFSSAVENDPNLNGAVVIANSAALEQLKNQLEGLREQMRRNNDEAVAGISGIGLDSSVAQQTEAFTRTNLETLRNVLQAQKEIEQAKSRVLNFDKLLDAEAENQTLTTQELNRLLAERNAWSMRTFELEQAIRETYANQFSAITGQVLLLARRAEFEIRQENAVLAIEAANARLLSTFEIQNNELGKRAVQAKIELDTAQVRDAQARRSGEQSIAALNEQRSILQQQIDLLEQIDPLERSLEQREQLDFYERALVAIQSQTVALQEKLSLEQQIRDAALATAEAKEREAQIRLEGSFADQIRLALVDIERELPTRFELILDTVKSTLQGFTSFISDSIVDAFDPSKKVDIKERFGRFLQDIARQIINMLVQIALVRLALNLTGVPVGLAGGGVVPQGFARGGGVRRPRQHRRRMGFDTGGGVEGPGAPSLRPSSVAASDTVPAWLTPGEFVQPVNAVQAYGADFMEGLRTLMFDPMQLRSLAGIRPMARHHSGPGFAEGGGVATAAAPAAAPASASGPTPAIVVASDATAEKLWKGGKTAWIRMMEEAGFQRG